MKSNIKLGDKFDYNGLTWIIVKTGDTKSAAMSTDMQQIKKFNNKIIYKNKINVVDEDNDKWIPDDMKTGAFTRYCGGKVTQKCIDKGKKSKNPLTRKRATLAQTLRKIAKNKKKNESINEYKYFMRFFY